VVLVAAPFCLPKETRRYHPDRRMRTTLESLERRPDVMLLAVRT
jgi:hypothetical protein